MKKKFAKSVGLLMAACILAITVTVPAMAASFEPVVETNDGSYLKFEPNLSRSTPISFSFDVSVNSGSVSSSPAFKDDSDGYATVNSLKSSTVSSKNKMSFRVRLDSSSQPEATGLYTRENTTGFDMWYKDGHGGRTKYKLWASAPSANKITVSMSGKFYP